MTGILTSGVREAVMDNVARDPSRTAYTFLSFPAGAGAEPTTLSRAELDAAARRVAAALTAARAERALLLAEPGLDFVAGLMGCVYAGVGAVPCPPVTAAGPSADRERVLFTARDAEVQAVLATPVAEPAVSALRGERVALRTVVSLTDPDGDADAWRPGAVDPDGLALLQYTSGSTGAPKAVAVSPANLTEQLAVFQRATGLPRGGSVVSWIPVYHALGVAGHLLFAQYVDGDCTFLRPEDFVAEPIRWLRAIGAASGPVFAAAPNFAYQRCVDRVTEEQRADLDLSGWHTALNAAERIRPETLAAFQDVFGPCGFGPQTMFPGYGMTETMLLISGRHGPDPLVLDLDGAALEQGIARPARPGGRTQRLVGNGYPVDGQRIVVVDPHTREVCAEDRVGEVWVAGPVVTQGYWRRPEQTAETFDGRLADGTGPFLRTGDLAVRHAGELVLCGRVKELIIIRGRNLYPQDIVAAAATALPVPGPGSAFAVDIDGTERLVVVASAASTLDNEQADAVRRAVTAAHQVDVHEVLLVSPDQIPVTASGKVRQAACRQAYLDGDLRPVAVSRSPESARPVTGATPPGGDDLTAGLRERVAAALRLPAEQVPVDQPLAGLGLESLRAIELRRTLERDYAVTVPMAELLPGTVTDLSRYLATRLDAGTGRTPDDLVTDPAHRHDPFPLTDLQQAYFVGRAAGFALGNVSIHFYGEFDTDQLDPVRLHRALDRLVARQEMLRATVSADGTQRILPVADVPPLRIPVLDLSTVDEQECERRLEEVRDELSHQVIPAGHWPMFDVRVSRLPDGWRTHVSLDLLIADVASVRLFFQEWGEFYRAPEQSVEPPGISFRDWVLAARQTDDGARARAWEYWRARLADLPPGPDLPLLSNGDARTRTRRTHLLPAEDWQALRDRAAARGLTPSTVLLAGYAYVLARWSGSGHFTLNVPLFNRPAEQPEIADVIGDFTTVTLLECDVRAEDGIAELARRLQDQLWRDLEHRAVSGVEVIREIARVRGIRADAFAPVVFASAREQGRDRSGTGGPLGARWLGRTGYAISQTPQVLLDHQVYEDGGGLSMNWDAVEGRFPPGLLDDLFDTATRLLAALAADDGAWAPDGFDPLPARHRQIVSASHDTTGSVPDRYLFSGIVEWAERDPDRTAVVAADATLSFGAWYRHANALGRRLRDAGVRPGDLVAVAADKSAAQLVAVLAVHLAGGAYLPVDPDLPLARQDLLLRHGEVRQVLTRAGGPDREWPDGVEPIPVDLAADPDAVEPLEPVQRPTDPAYVLYTSGSTGAPKGVVVSHRAAVNTLVDVAARIGLSAPDRVLGLSALSFDLSVWDVFGVPGAGGATVLPEPAAARNPARWLELMAAHRVTLWNSVPALLQMLVEHAPDGHPGLATLRLAWLSGDWIPLDLPERLAGCAPVARLVASGGPTETAIWCVHHPVDRIDPGWESVPYGKPLRHHVIEVRNDRDEPCPLWVPGEMFIAGAGLADGYWRDPTRTAEMFPTGPDGRRWYRSGDFGRWRPDGTLEILGRRDGQVKVGGFRIELGEVEAALARHPRVRMAAVVATGPERQRRQLHAFVVPVLEKAALGDVVTDPVRRLEFTLQREGRRTDLPGVPVRLPATVPDEQSVELWQRRASCRAFAPEPVPLAELAGLLECLRDIPGGVLPRHRYASAGGLYPVQAYVYAAPGRVAGLDAGGYYYDPATHGLRPVSPGSLDAACQVSTNQDAFRAAAFTIFLVGHKTAIAPLYGNRSRDFSLLEAGLAAQLLEQTAADLGLGVCQVGLLREPEPVHELLRLADGDEVLHSLLGGRRVAGAAPAMAPAPDLAAGDDEFAERLRAELAEQLPAHLVPARITVLEQLPLTDRGKVDRAALARRPLAGAQEPEPVPPRDPLERTIADVLARVLGTAAVSSTANFFDLGANSAQVVAVHRELRSALQRDFPLIQMFEHTTVRRLAAALGDGGGAGNAGNAGKGPASGFERAQRRRRARGEDISDRRTP
jgi:amino acid adenylation domain-containing protein